MKPKEKRKRRGNRQAANVDNQQDARSPSVKEFASTFLGMPLDPGPVNQNVPLPDGPAPPHVAVAAHTPPAPSATFPAHNQDLVNFGTLICTSDTSISISLRGSSKGPTPFVLGGYGEYDFLIPGAAKRTCLLVLELVQPPKLPLCRKVELKRIDSRNQHVSIIKGDTVIPLDQSTTLSDGDRVCFGYERWYPYWAPLYSELYQLRTSVYGHNHPNPNSSVIRVVQKSDGLPFVSKTIRLKCERMAKIEIEAFKTIGHHPNIVRMVEKFFDATTLSYPFALSEPGSRDVKPQNILIFGLGRSKVTIKLCDFGIVRLNTRSASREWNAGTKHWMAPKSFRVVDDSAQSQSQLLVLDGLPPPPTLKRIRNTIFRDVETLVSWRRLKAAYHLSTA
ncbi:hypothetical protein FRB90_006142 [Tulasnella sp. 427]|nr:hypothetical protein FRB90_006142 [Tulasnella sp. 427]